MVFGLLSSELCLFAAGAALSASATVGTAIIPGGWAGEGSTLGMGPPCLEFPGRADTRDKVSAGGSHSSEPLSGSAGG